MTVTLEWALPVLLAAAAWPAVILTGPREQGEAIRALDKSWAAAFGRKELDSVMSNYADDAALLPPDEPIVLGRDAIRSWFEKRFAVPGYSADFAPVSIVVSEGGDLAYEVGVFRATITGAGREAEVYAGKHLVAWARRNGRWQVVAESFNRDAPRPQR